jgi:hypothetical protein
VTRRLTATLLLLVGSAACARPVATQLHGSRQLLLVLGDGWDSSRGQLYRLARPTTTARWTVVGSPLAIWLGRSGLAWRSDPGAPPPPSRGPRKREGDGRSPAGLLSLDELWGYDGVAPAGVKLAYSQADASARCVDDVESPLYNQLVRQTASPPPWRSAEQLRMPTDHYKYLVVLGYNRQPVQRGAGSCIFLHVAPPPQGPTAGCTALAESELLALLRWLEPTDKPLLLQVPRETLTQTVKAWQLPAELPRALSVGK